MRIPESARGVLESNALGHLVTINADGSPQVTCVWMGIDGDDLVCAHLPRHQKVRNMQRDPRVVVSFPVNSDDMLLSGVLVGGQALSGRAQVVDAPVGQGHVVMFAIRPYWRWQTQGTFFLGFNAILNWNDLDAGRPGAPRPGTAQ